MSNITFLSTFFPTLSLTELHFMSMEDLEYALEQNLSLRDQKAVNQIWLLGDVENVRSYLNNEPMTRKGSLTPENILAIFSSEERSPRWLWLYMKDFPEEADRIQHEHLLSRYCLKYSVKDALHSSIASLLSLEYTSRKILERARSGAINNSEKSDEGRIDEKWMNETSNEWPEEYQQLLYIWTKLKNSPIDLEKEIAEWRFSVLEKMREEASPFSLDRLIYSIALFDFIESRRPLTDETKKAPQERIIQAVCNDSY